MSYLLRREEFGHEVIQNIKSFVIDELIVAYVKAIGMQKLSIGVDNWISVLLEEWLAQ